MRTLRRKKRRKSRRKKRRRGAGTKRRKPPPPPKNWSDTRKLQRIKNPAGNIGKIRPIGLVPVTQPRRLPLPPRVPVTTSPFTNIDLGQQMRERGRRAQLVRSGTPTFGEQFKGTGAANIAAHRPLSVSEHYDPRDRDYAFVARAVPAARQGKPSRRKRIAAWWRAKKKKGPKKETSADKRWDKYANSGGRRRRTRRKRRRRRRSRSKRGGNQEECCISTKCPPKGYSLVKNAPPPPPPPGPTAASGATKQGSQTARGALLGSIQGFKKGALKKASKAKSKKASKGKGGLLAAIRARPKLKTKAEQKKLKPKPKPKPGKRSALGAMSNAITAHRGKMGYTNNNNNNNNNGEPNPWN